MRKKQMIELLATHANRLIANQADEIDDMDLSDADRSQITQIKQFAGQIKETLVPITCSPEFKARLKQDLMTAYALDTEGQAEQNRDRVPVLRRRWVLVGAAAGSVALSAAGILAAVLLRQRSTAHL